MYFEFCSNISLFTETWRPSCRSNKVGIPVSTASTGAESYHFSWFCEIMEELTIFFVVDEGSHGEFDDSIFGISSMHELDSTTLTILSGYFFDIAKIRESIDIGISDDDEIASTSSITSKWASFCNTGLTSPRNDSISTVSRTKSHIYSIDEHNCVFISRILLIFSIMLGNLTNCFYIIIYFFSMRSAVMRALS